MAVIRVNLCHIGVMLLCFYIGKEFEQLIQKIEI